MHVCVEEDERGGAEEGGGEGRKRTEKRFTGQSEVLMRIRVSGRAVVHHFASLTQTERAYQPSGYHNIIHCCTAHG